MDRILIVVGDVCAGEVMGRDNAEPLRAGLAAAGFELVMVSSLAEARTELERAHFAAALVDVGLRCKAEVGGLALARELSRTSPDTRIVLTSDVPLTERQLERADCGATAFLPRPFDVSALGAFVREHLDAPPPSRRLWHAHATGASQAGATHA